MPVISVNVYYGYLKRFIGVRSLIAFSFQKLLRGSHPSLKIPSRREQDFRIL